MTGIVRRAAVTVSTNQPPNQPPAGWYADPERPGFMRYWDGGRWSDHPGGRRPVQQGSPPQQDRPSVRRRGGARKAAIAVAVAAALAFAGMWVLGFWLYATHDHPGGFIGDDRFVSEANRICSRAARQRPEPANEESTMAERADTVARSAAVMGEMVKRLREIPVARADAQEVDAWLDRWEEFVAVGHRYADAIRANSPDLTDIGNEGDAPASDINGFAANNGLDDCVW